VAQGISLCLQHLTRKLTLAGAHLISIAIKDLVCVPAAETIGLETARTLTATLGLWLKYKGLGGHRCDGQMTVIWPLLTSSEASKAFDQASWRKS